ncbi:hypothetical protein SAFG77S_04584 [Streptomyces afghaniensis]
MLRALDARAAGQWGLVTTAQAKLDGVQGVQLLRLERSGALESVGHGVYRLAASPPPEHLRIKVAWLRLDPGTPVRDRRTDGPRSGVVSHTSACAVHGLGGRPHDPVELTVSSRRTTRDETVVLHRAAMDAEDITVVDGLPVTTVPRTVVNLLEARADAARAGAFVAEAADRGLVSVTTSRHGSRASPVPTDCPRRHPARSCWSSCASRRGALCGRGRPVGPPRKSPARGRPPPRRGSGRPYGRSPSGPACRTRPCPGS